MPTALAPADDVRGNFQTKNFVVTGTTVRVAQRIGERAEKQRRALARLWLGKDLPDWPTPSPIAIRLGEERLAGASTFDFARPAESWAPVCIHLAGNLDGILNNSLPHEITHTILADHFRRPVPRWADEGASVLCEDGVIHRRYKALLGDADRHGQLYTLNALFGMSGYPPRVDVMYAEGYSVTQFLVSRKDRAAFLAFLRTGMDGDWAGAARQCYGFESIDAMQASWIESVRKPEGK
jgi:peptidase MA superfamily protein